MKQMLAVVGFLPDADAKAWASQGQHTDQLKVRTDDDVHVAVRGSDVLGVLAGASQKGETAVQVLLKDGAKVDTISTGLVSDLFRPIRDLSFLKFRPPINVIYYDPRLVAKLVQLNRENVT